MKISSATLNRDIRDDRASQGMWQFFDEDGSPVEFFSGQYHLYTLENPWLDNQRMASCIPAGKYICRRTISPTYGETFEIVNVENRTHILIHWGNYVRNTDGCVLVGKGRDEEMPAVWTSRDAHKSLMEAAEGVDEFPLEIIDYQEAA